MIKYGKVYGGADPEMIEGDVFRIIVKEPEKQVISKKRVSDHGEGYTASREVNAMLDLVKFEDKKVRIHWDEKTEKWYLSVIDIISTLTESSIPKRYWTDLKKKLVNEGSQLYEKIVQLKILCLEGMGYGINKGGRKLGVEGRLF